MKKMRMRAAMAGVILNAGIAGAADDPNLACRSAIEAGLQRWATRTLSVRQKCLARGFLGIQPAASDCRGADPQSPVRDKLGRIDGQLERRVLLGCDGADFTFLSYPGPCPDPVGHSFQAEDLVACIGTLGRSAIDDMLASQYPGAVEPYRGSQANCLGGIGGRALAMLSRDLRTRLQCQLGQETGKVGPGVDCRALPLPYGAGTGSEVHDAVISRAYLSWLSHLPPSCGRIDLAGIGYGSGCPAPLDGSFDIQDLRKCVFRANIQEGLTLVDLAFPSDPVCGNGIEQDGEACDDGLANSDTAPDACRETCDLPSCGDAVTDPSLDETCDDGNVAALDGCNAVCTAEFCGDAITNDSPPEQCDDGNASSGDRCTTACRNAVCGDGFLCSAPACTSGPSGGAEQCDEGAANAADGACHGDCSGFQHTCEVTVGITSSHKLGAITYETNYDAVAGEFLGSGSGVKCVSLVAGGLFTFNDNEARRAVRESLILAAGFSAPLAIARCKFATNNAALAGSAFTFTVIAASDPAFHPLTPTLAATSVACD